MFCFQSKKTTSAYVYKENNIWILREEKGKLVFDLLGFPTCWHQQSLFKTTSKLTSFN